jgi:hypothetical protein
MFLSLDQTGRQLVSGLTSQEDASLLRRSVHLLAPSQPTAQVSLVVGANILRRSVQLLAPAYCAGQSNCWRQPTAQVSQVVGASLLRRSVHCCRQPTVQVSPHFGASLLRRSVQLLAPTYCAGSPVVGAYLLRRSVQWLAPTYCAGQFMCWRQSTAQDSSFVRRCLATVHFSCFGQLFLKTGVQQEHSGILSRIHERTISSRFLFIILIVLRLEVPFYNVYITNECRTTFARKGGGEFVNRGDCECSSNEENS